MSDAQQKTLDDFIQLQNRNALSHVTRAVVDLGIIKALQAGQRTAEQLADELELDLPALKQLLDVALATELIERYGDDFALSQVARLVPDQFLGLGDFHWQHLAQHVKTGSGVPAPDGLPSRDFHYALEKSSQEWMLTPAAMAAAQALDIGKSRRGLRILEIGCGSAVFGATFIHSDPDSTVNLVDNEFGLQRAKGTIDSVGLERQTTYIQADSIDDLSTISAIQGQQYDLVVLVGHLHRKSPEQCDAWFDQLQSLVKPDRELALIDVFPGQEKGDQVRAIFELELGLRTSSGQLHDPLKLEASLKSSGFGQIQFAHLPAAPYYWGLILAQRD